MSSADDVQQPSSNHQESTTNDWPW
jgi:hypothetical protein